MDKHMPMPRADQPVLRIESLHAAYCSAPVLNDVWLSLRAGEVACILGPAGSGKTTLLRCINALMPVLRGSVRVMGIEVNDPRLDKPKLRRHVGMAALPPGLFPHWTVLQNVALPQVQILKRPRDVAEADARALLSALQLDACAHAWPGELSACQQQRTAIARSLAMKPGVMLLDDIATTLHARMTGTVLQVIRQYAAGGAGCILATRDDRLADHADRVHTLDRGTLLFRNVSDPCTKVAELVNA